MTQYLVKDLARYIPAYIVPVIVSVITIPIITNLFTPADFGNYVLVMTTGSIVALLTTSWLSNSIIRFYPIYKIDNRLVEFYGIVIKCAVIIIVAVSLLLVAVLFLCKDYLSGDLYPLIYLAVLPFISGSLSGIFTGFLRSTGRATYYSLFMIWNSGVGLGLGMVLIIVFHFGLGGLLWGYFLSVALTMPFLYKYVPVKSSHKMATVNSPMTREMFRYSFPLVVESLSWWTLASSSIYIIQLFRGSAEVGIFTANSTISGKIMILILTLFTITEGPLVFYVWEKQGYASTAQFVRKVTRYYLLLALPAAVGIGVLARPIVSVFIGPEYQAGYVIIPLTAFAFLLTGIINRFTIALACRKRTDIVMYCVLGAALLNIVLTFVLVPQYGFVAAAVATLVVTAADMITVIIISRYFLTWPFPLKSLAKITCASAIMGAVVYFVFGNLASSTLANLLIGIVTGILVFTVVLLVLREPEQAEIQALKIVGDKVGRKIRGLRRD